MSNSYENIRSLIGQDRPIVPDTFIHGHWKGNVELSTTHVVRTAYTWVVMGRIPVNHSMDFMNEIVAKKMDKNFYDVERNRK